LVVKAEKKRPLEDLDVDVEIRGCIKKFPDWVDNEIYAYLRYFSLRNNTKGYGGKTYYTDSQNIDTTAPSGRELYHLQVSLQAVSPETFGYTLVILEWILGSWEGRCGLDAFASEQGPVAGSCEQGNEPSGSIQRGKFPDHFSYY
jgi:hypothetical protein